MSDLSVRCSTTSSYSRPRLGEWAKFGRSAQYIAKRVFDLGGALAIIACLCPLFVIVATLIAIFHGRPIFFGHKRVGHKGKQFSCLKFRTMVNDGDAVLKDYFDGNAQARLEWLAVRKLKDDPRVTAIGRVLRRSSIDELPQLFNVLRGEMSLVGPRPIVTDEVIYYAEAIESYVSVKPGMTGPWQVGGRSDVSYEARVKMDCDYVANASLWRDLVILLQTVPAVVASRGSY